MARGKRIKYFESGVFIAGFLCCFIATGAVWESSVACAGSAPEGREFPVTEIQVDIRENARVKGDRIDLKSIAEIKAGDDWLEKIGNIPFGPSPRPGAEKVIPGSWIASKIHAEKWIPDPSRISVPEYVRVTRESQSITDERLRALFEKFIAEGIKGEKFKVSRFKVRGERDFSSGKMELIFRDFDRSRMMGRVTATVIVNIEGRERGRIFLSGWIDRYEKIVRTTRTIPKGSVLNKSDLCLESINISKAPEDLVTSTAEVAGKLAKRRIKSGSYVRHRMLEVPPLIHEGDRVKMVVRTGLLTVSTVGVAKGRGGKGEQVQVENLTSGKTVAGQVADASTVEVLF